MHSLSDLQSGRLAHESRIDLACGLSEFPDELFGLANSLEVLNLSGNRLNQLPDDFGRFKKLRILFLSDNDFQVFPQVLAQCPSLSMVGFKANHISQVPEGSLPPKIRWLILTDNQIETLPVSIGRHQELQKLMLAGNCLRHLPDELRNCSQLELLRISANQLHELPNWLTQMPKLSWLAFAGNPCCAGDDIEHSLEAVHWDELQLSCRLGEGASGVISKARWNDRVDVAMKEFKGAVTSDGLPADEMVASIAAGQHQHLVEVLAKVAGHPEQKSGLLMSLIDEEFSNLAGPPSFASCTRDVYPEGRSFSLSDVYNIAEGIASVAWHLHERKIMHGDLYGHNILVNQAADCLLGDFGAASLYDNLPAELTASIERLEVRAFGCLLEELLDHLGDANASLNIDALSALKTLQAECVNEQPPKRPTFKDICSRIEEANPFSSS